MPDAGEPRSAYPLWVYSSLSALALLVLPWIGAERCRGRDVAGLPARTANARRTA